MKKNRVLQNTITVPGAKIIGKFMKYILFEITFIKNILFEIP